MKAKAIVVVRHYIKVEIDVPDDASHDETAEKILDYYWDELPDPDSTETDVYDIEFPED